MMNRTKVQRSRRFRAARGNSDHIVHLCLVLLLILAGSSHAAAIRKVLSSDEIPKRLFIGSHFIFHESDSLYLNGRLLQRGDDYSFSANLGAFDLSSLEISPGDTLIACYRKLPPWLEVSYGRELPPASTSAATTPRPQQRPVGVLSRTSASSVSISGAKSFRFSARTAGSSEFSQSLDLTISGELAPGVTITGAVSDRGYDPSYGTANSRLNELDKVNLRLTSPSITAQVGDIETIDRLSSVAPTSRAASGAMFVVQRERWHVDAMAARPKGRYASVRFMGRDGLQGPYAISESGRPLPVAPRSEQVWLDGERLERGTNKDYTVDYPTGRITFNVNHPIDSRRRIEVDFQPLASGYKGELLSTGGSAIFGDSLLTIALELRRDGDDKDQPLWGEPTAEDRRLLARVGDSTVLAVRSGVRPDSTGSYLLVTDSLPDSVYQYVGRENGDYSITFSFAGVGAGSYRFLGTDQYEYVGDGGGDYLPVVAPIAPERADHYRLRARLRSRVLGQISTDIRQSVYDRNLFSSLDDSDNDGLYYLLRLDKKFGKSARTNELSLEVRHRQTEYRTHERLNAPEFQREFLLPEHYTPTSDETLYRWQGAVTPSRFVTVRTGLSRLEYEHVFSSNKVNVRAEMKPHYRVEAVAGFEGMRSRFTSGDSTQRGNGEYAMGQLRLLLADGITLSSMLESDNRKHDYSGTGQGTRYQRYELGLSGRSESLRYEQYREDSLTGRWLRTFQRRRASLASNRRLGDLSYQFIVTHQWLDKVLSAEKSFLGRLGYRYHDGKRNLTVDGAYVVSTETRNARGLTYLEVEPGRGNFIFQDGTYLPDPDGDYIQVEELLSDRSRVRRGERSFHLRREFSQVYIRFDSRIEEELLDEGAREWYWLVPFLSDKSQPFLFYDRRYDADIRLAKMHSFHVVNLSYSEDMQQRLAAGKVRQRSHRKETVSLKQVVNEVFFEETLDLFQIDRDQSYGGGGDVDGFKVGLSARRRFSTLELTVGGVFRRAESSQGELSRIYLASLGARRQLARKGELRTLIELYTQQLTNIGTTPSYFLTDNKPGERGAIWSVRLNYGLKGELRLNFSLTGRHADNRTARLTGRGELVAGF